MNPQTASTALHPAFSDAWITRVSVLHVTEMTHGMLSSAAADLDDASFHLFRFLTLYDTQNFLQASYS